MIESKLFIAPANSIIGLNTNSFIEIYYTDIDCDILHCTIDTIKDELFFNVNINTIVNIYYKQQLGFPIYTLSLRHINSHVGFEDNQVKFSPEIFNIFDNGYYVLSQKKSYLIPCKEANTFEEYFDSILTGNSMGYFIIYNPTETLYSLLKNKQFQEPSKDMIFQIKTKEEYMITVENVKYNINFLFDIANLCDGIIIWSFSYGRTPHFISKNSTHFLNKFKIKCKAIGFELIEVESESKLPEW